MNIQHPNGISQLHAWILALRLPTLFLSIAATVSGHIAAWQYGLFSSTIAFWGILTAILLQILSNLANDYGDAAHQADNAQRTGPLRMVSGGYISPKSMKKGIVILLILCLISGSLLIRQAHANYSHLSWLLWLMGALSIWAAVAYTIGKKPYGYWGAGDIAVFIFFGWLAVLGSFYLQTARLHLFLLPLASALGLWCAAVLNINNMRDRENDKRHGKITIAVRLGEKNMRHYHSLLISTGALCWLIYLSQSLRPTHAIIIGIITLYFSGSHIHTIYTRRHAEVLNQQLKIWAFLILIQVALLGLASWI